MTARPRRHASALVRGSPVAFVVANIRSNLALAVTQLSGPRYVVVGSVVDIEER
jgi:hypothetical protein